MNHCKQCGKQLDDDARFCPSCGTPTTTAATAKQPSVIPPTASIDYKEGTATRKPLSKQRKTTIAIIAAIVASALVVALVVLRSGSLGDGIFGDPSPVGTWSAWQTDDGKKPDYNKTPYYLIQIDKDGKITTNIKESEYDKTTHKLTGKYAKEQMQTPPSDDGKKNNFYHIDNISMSDDFFGDRVTPTISIMTPQSGLIGQWSITYDFLEKTEYHYADVMENGTIRTKYDDPYNYISSGTGTGKWEPVPCDQKGMVRYKLTFDHDTWWVQGPKKNLKVK
jgi:hypothetical protein